MKPEAIALLIRRIARSALGGRNLDREADAFLRPLRKRGDVPQYTLTTSRRLMTIQSLAKLIERGEQS